MIKELIYNTGGVRNKFAIAQSSNRTLCGRSSTQRPGESLHDCGERFLVQVATVEAVIGNLLPSKFNQGSADDKAAAHHQHLASLFLGGADMGRHKAAADELNN